MDGYESLTRRFPLPKFRIGVVHGRMKPEDKEKHKSSNENLAKSRIKLGLLLNEYGEKNNLKVSDDEVRNEIQKQVKSMPGQEKFVFEYYQKNPSATQHLQSSIYEEKIIKFFKTKISSVKKELTIKEAEKLIKSFNENNKAKATSVIKKKESKPAKSKKISKK